MKIKEKIIKITGIYEASKLVEEAMKVDGEVTVKRGKYAIDAKSFMGIMAIGIAEGAVIEYPETATDFENFLNQFETNKIKGE